MSGFSADWLALREPVDHRSRDLKLAAAVARHFRDAEDVAVIDLGCGTGSNVRATSPLLPTHQRWRLVDYDANLLAAARKRLADWADRATHDGEALVLEAGGRQLTVVFEQADLQADVERVLAVPADLVTASALFDLVSRAFLDRFAAAAANTRAAVYSVLTYDGRQTWQPADPADAAMAEAFHAHQRRDKGFGTAAGPRSSEALTAALAEHGYDVSEGDSPWRLETADASLVRELAGGFADAVAETGAVSSAEIARWRGVPRNGALVGHRDHWALPAS